MFQNLFIQMRLCCRGFWHQFKNNQKPFPKNVLFTAPHASFGLPIQYIRHLSLEYKTNPRLLRNFSDYGTRYLLDFVPESQKVLAKYGRIIGDPNRNQENPQILRFTDFGGNRIFTKRFENRLRKSWFKKLWLKKVLKKSYFPFYKEYYEKLELLHQNLPEGIPIFLIDLHDTGNILLGKTKKQDRIRPYENKMPPVVISNAPDMQTGQKSWGTCPPEQLDTWKNIIYSVFGYKDDQIQLNKPFLGGNVIRELANPFQNKELKEILTQKDGSIRQIYAIQLEFNRSLYMNESTQNPNITKLRRVCNALEEVVTEFTKRNQKTDQ